MFLDKFRGLNHHPEPLSKLACLKSSSSKLLAAATFSKAVSTLVSVPILLLGSRNADFTDGDFSLSSLPPPPFLKNRFGLLGDGWRRWSPIPPT